MIAERALRALRDAAGEDAVLEHDPISLDGVKVSLTLAPESSESLAATLACCNEHGLPLVVRGGGSRIGVGNRPDAGVAAWLSTAALDEPTAPPRARANSSMSWKPSGVPRPRPPLTMMSASARLTVASTSSTKSTTLART